MKLWKCATVTVAVTWLATSSEAQAQFLEEFPKLQQYLWNEPLSSFYLGFGLSPVGIMKHKVYFSASVFQAHWTDQLIDWELLGFSVGYATARNSYANSKHFLARTVPKLRVLKNISVGLLGGLEYVSFPEVKSRMYYDTYSTPEEPFASQGWVYGAVASVNFALWGGFFRLSPMYYKQTYPYRDLQFDWHYRFTNKELEGETGDEQIAPDSVFAIEMSFLI